MIGDHGFEFFDNRNVENFIQIPWEEVDTVIASLVFGGRWIPRLPLKLNEVEPIVSLLKNP
ncbi:Uncharacterized protein conserved in bacteria [Pediococcus pentosaceus]|nr:Uncharacterized protein conserved in bacteria [Pediococcus pentosaceus]